MKQEKILTVEQKERKDRLRFRLFVLLIIIDIALVIYLAYEIISTFSMSGSKTAIDIIENTKNLIR